MESKSTKLNVLTNEPLGDSEFEGLDLKTVSERLQRANLENRLLSDGRPTASRLLNQFMLLEFLGSFMYTCISAGAVIASGVLTHKVSYSAMSPGRLLYIGLGNGLVRCPSSFPHISMRVDPSVPLGQNP